MDLNKKLIEYEKELEKTKILLYNISGAIQAIKNLIEEKGKENSKNYLRENPDLALQLENDVYKAVGMVESEETTKEEAVEDDSTEKKETNKKK